MIKIQTTQWRQTKQQHTPTLRDAKSLHHDNDDRWRGEEMANMKMKLRTSCCSYRWRDDDTGCNNNRQQLQLKQQHKIKMIKDRTN